MPSILLACFMGGVIYLVNFIGLSTIVTLIIQIILGAVIYVGIAKLLNYEPYNYIIDYFKKLLKRNVSKGE